MKTLPELQSEMQTAVGKLKKLQERRRHEINTKQANIWTLRKIRICEKRILAIRQQMDDLNGGDAA